MALKQKDSQSINTQSGINICQFLRLWSTNKRWSLNRSHQNIMLIAFNRKRIEIKLIVINSEINWPFQMLFVYYKKHVKEPINNQLFNGNWEELQARTNWVNTLIIGQAEQHFWNLPLMFKIRQISRQWNKPEHRIFSPRHSKNLPTHWQSCSKLNQK